MYVELVHKEEDKGFIRALKFRVLSERVFDSPLHALPELTQLLVQKSLSSYVVHFIPNIYGRFDLEIKSEYPELKDNLLSMDLRKKVGRLHRLFYESPLKEEARFAYDDFIHALSLYTPRYRCPDDETLFTFPIEWHGLLETYQFLHTEDIEDEDFYHAILKHTDETWVSPAMNHKPCPFDKADFFESQVISGFSHFFLCLNYRPIGDSPFHVMIVPYQHETDLVRMTPNYLFELEALLRATLKLWPDGYDGLFIYMQKHASSGMTVPHMHIHVLFPSKNQAFREDIIQQLRYFASLMGGHEEEAEAFARAPLSKAFMQREIWRFKSPLKKQFEHELRVQHDRYAKLKLHRFTALKKPIKKSG